MKRLLVGVLVILGMMCSFCEAGSGNYNRAYDRSLDNSAIALGGITFGMSTTEVEAIYGRPTKVTEEHIDHIRSGKSFSYIYGDSFEIMFNKGCVSIVITKANNGIATPAGLHVGDAKGKIITTYGNPWYYSHEKDGSETYSYRAENYSAIRFDVYNGQITSIRIIGMD